MRYLAVDGTIFDSMNECQNYEENIGTRLIGDIPHLIVDGDELFDGSFWNLYVFIRIETKEQLNRFQKWLHAYHCELHISEELIGHELIVDCYNEKDDTLDNISEIYSVDTVEENIEKYIKKLESYVQMIGREKTSGK